MNIAMITVFSKEHRAYMEIKQVWYGDFGW